MTEVEAILSPLRERMRELDPLITRAEAWQAQIGEPLVAARIAELLDGLRQEQRHLTGLITKHLEVLRRP